MLLTTLRREVNLHKAEKEKVIIIDSGLLGIKVKSDDLKSIKLVFDEQLLCDNLLDKLFKDTFFSISLHK